MVSPYTACAAGTGPIQLKGKAFDNAKRLNIEKAPWASPRKEVRPMRQFLVELAIQVIAGILVALIVDALAK